MPGFQGMRGVLLAAWIAGGSLGIVSMAGAQICGDFVCQCGSGENNETCPEDCGFCGDLRCDPGETHATCPTDCGICGDLSCDGEESSASCPEDCGPCGDLECVAGESACDVDCNGGMVECQVAPPPHDSDEEDGGDKGSGGGIFGGGCSLMLRAPD